MSALLAVLLPLGLAFGAAALAPGRAAWLYRLAPWAPLALLAPLLVAPSGGETSLLLLGVSLAPDDTARPLIWLTAIGWSLAGWYALGTIGNARRWFWTGWLGALTGMHLLLLAGDIATFYIGYAVVSLSAYLLVTHARTAGAWRAGRVYLVMALLGEAAILVGVLLLGGALGNAPLADLPAAAPALEGSAARWLLFAGFAVKLGILPLHVWLPLAHPVAPVPASAILSGIIVKAGLLGWLRFVPASPADPAWIATALVALGLLTAFGGVALGLGQERLKTILAYSTISQMGLVLMGFGLLFAESSERAAVVSTLGVLALHHGLSKTSLFLACGSAPGASRFRMLLFALPALSLAAAPLTTGYLAKNGLKGALALGPTVPAASLLLSLTSAGTALLLWKAFRLARQSHEPTARLHPAWPAAVVAALAAPWAYAARADLLSPPTLLSLAEAVWPLLLSAALVLAFRRAAWPASYRLPEGDIVVALERAAGALGRAVSAARAARPAVPALPDLAAARAALGALEREQARLPLVGLLLLALGALLSALVWWGGTP